MRKEKTVYHKGEPLTLKQVDHLLTLRQGELDFVASKIGKWYLNIKNEEEKGIALLNEIDKLSDCRALLISELWGEENESRDTESIK